MTIKASLLVAAVLALPTLARAQGPAAAAQEHIDRASSLHKAGRLADALVELKTAYALEPRPQLLFAMGQIHVQLGQCADALTYYERYLATSPAPEIAAITREAIDACKTNPPPAMGMPAPEPTPEPVREAAPLPVPAPVPVPAIERRPPWYADRVGDALVAGGVVSGVVGFLLWRGAVSDRDEADSTDNYERFGSLIDSAHGKQTQAIVFGIASAVLVTAGGVHIVLHHRATDLVVAPTPGGGGAVTWLGRF